MRRQKRANHQADSARRCRLRFQLRRAESSCRVAVPRESGEEKGEVLDGWRTLGAWGEVAEADNGGVGPGESGVGL